VVTEAVRSRSASEPWRGKRSVSPVVASAASSVESRCTELDLGIDADVVKTRRVIELKKVSASSTSRRPAIAAPYARGDRATGPGRAGAAEPVGESATAQSTARR
jgi:hypothetical protein